VALPTGTTKRISQFAVFAVTVAFSLWAYLWLTIVYSFWTPGVITIAEGVITLASFPALLLAGACEGDLGADAQRRLNLPHFANGRLDVVDGAAPLIP
jgi:hypothetical protein